MSFNEIIARYLREGPSGSPKKYVIAYDLYTKMPLKEAAAAMKLAPSIFKTYYKKGSKIVDDLVQSS